MFSGMKYTEFISHNFSTNHPLYCGMSYDGICTAQYLQLHTECIPKILWYAPYHINHNDGNGNHGQPHPSDERDAKRITTTILLLLATAVGIPRDVSL